jgi:hypothetical protein
MDLRDALLEVILGIAPHLSVSSLGSRWKDNPMFRLHQLSATLAIIMLGAMAAPARPASTTGRDAVEITDLQPFAHVAYLPAGSDLSSIKIESIKAVKEAAKRRSITIQQFCAAPWSEPGGSMYCQRTTDESSEPAYRVTFSYTGLPMASDEYGSRYFTFSVYLRPTEISPGLRDMLSAGKNSQARVAELFEIATSTDAIQQVVIDEANSTFCDGISVDGNWIHTNPACEDRIAYKKIVSPSPYITVRVDPASHLETGTVTGLQPK